MLSIAAVLAAPLLGACSDDDDVPGGSDPTLDEPTIVENPIQTSTP